MTRFMICLSSGPLLCLDLICEAMAERFSSESLPGQLADNMAELVTRLRLSSTLPVFTSTESVCLPRLVVMARILEKMGSDAPGLAQLGQTIVSLSDLLKEVPAAGGPALEPSLQRLVEFLESFLVGVDRGDDLKTWLNHPRWLSLQLSFTNYQTPLAVFDELDDVLHRFHQQRAHSLQPNCIPEAMAARWAEVCRQGDLVFGVDSRVIFSGISVIILLDSETNRHFLGEKLVTGGAEVIVATNPAQAWEICRSHASSPAVLCDQIGPRNNLTEFCRLVEQAPQPLNNSFILVTSGDSSGQYSNLERALKLGAHGVWRDPYELGDLLPCILQGRQRI